MLIKIKRKSNVKTSGMFSMSKSAAEMRYLYNKLSVRL